MTIDAQLLNQRSAQLILAVGTVLILGLAFAAFQQYGALDDARTRLAGEEEAVDEAEAQLDRRLELAEESEEMEETLKIMEDMVPPKPDESGVISDIQDWADEAAIDFISIQFADRVEEEEYVQMPVELSFAGGYEDMLELTRHLIGAERAFRIEEVRMGGADGDPPELSVSIRCSVFYVIDE